MTTPIDLPDLSLTGGCGCDAVRYEVTSPPLTLYLCHCRACQRLGGSAFAMSMPVRRDGFAITRGSTTGWERQTVSGRGQVQHFCNRCGTRLYTLSDATTEVVTLRAGTLDDTSWLRPVAQAWTASRQPWLCIDDLLSFEGNAADPGELLRAWRAATRRRA